MTERQQRELERIADNLMDWSTRNSISGLSESDFKRVMLVSLADLCRTLAMKDEE
jgi:hypothetical protein